ncbi:MAG: formate--tetrahydrofolate ligase [Candidatus Hadarchaeia archaeon]
MRSDVEISNRTDLENIVDIAKKLRLDENEIEPLGDFKAKLSFDSMRDHLEDKFGNLILVTAMTPTRKGEGKTTVTIGLTQALRKIGKNATLGIREPSIGPTMGMKGGAAGGGYSQVLPMEDINLHFTGDLHAVGISHNLISAMINNRMHRGNGLNIDPRNVVWPRVMDMNDRALRNVVVGLGGSSDGMPNETSFGITASSEVMAVLCLSENILDLKERLSRITVAYNFDDKPIRISDIGGSGAMATLLKHAIKPNLVQTIEGSPAFVHGGPFANIAHGTSSIISTKIGMGLSDYFVTEAGFGSDLGAEKFFDIVCREGDIEPDATVLVVSARALKRQGGVPSDQLDKEDVGSLKEGFENLEKHIENIRMFGLPVVIAINRFPSDTDEELKSIKKFCQKKEISFSEVKVYQEGGDGGIDLAEKVVELCDNQTDFDFLYSLEISPRKKISKIAEEIYGAEEVVFTQNAVRDLERIEKVNMDDLPICMSKTHQSLSDDPDLLGRPRGFELKIKEIRINSGAGFLVPSAGEIRTMPGLPERSAAEDIDIDEGGNVSGLF